MQDATHVNYDNTTTAATPECGAKEAQPNQSPSKLVGSGSSGSAPRGIDEHIDWKTRHDPREDLFQSDERSGLHFPCNMCIHSLASADYCRLCKHYAL